MRFRLMLAAAASLGTAFAWHSFGLAFPTVLVTLVCGWAWYAVFGLAFRRWTAHLHRVFDQIEISG